jgi:hypothetical protein
MITEESSSVHARKRHLFGFKNNSSMTARLTVFIHLWPKLSPLPDRELTHSERRSDALGSISTQNPMSSKTGTGTTTRQLADTCNRSRCYPKRGTACLLPIHTP